MHRMTDIGAALDVVSAFEPTALDDSPSAGDLGTAIDRRTYDMPQSGVLHVRLGNATGSPTAIEVDAKVQHRETTTDDWEDLGDQPNGEDPAIAQLTAADAQGSVNFNLVGAKRYIRVRVDVDMTGGTSPTILVVATFVLGGARDLPR